MVLLLLKSQAQSLRLVQIRLCTEPPRYLLLPLTNSDREDAMGHVSWTSCAHILLPVPRLFIPAEIFRPVRQDGSVQLCAESAGNGHNGRGLSEWGTFSRGLRAPPAIRASMVDGQARGRLYRGRNGASGSRGRYVVSPLRADMG